MHADGQRVPGTAVFLFKDTGTAPPALLNNLRHNKVLHERPPCIVSVETADAPRVDAAERPQSRSPRSEPGVFQVLLTLRLHGGTRRAGGAVGARTCAACDFDPDDATYFIGRESMVAGKAPGMHPALEHLFVLAQPRRRQRRPVLQPARGASVRGGLAGRDLGDRTAATRRPHAGHADRAPDARRLSSGQRPTVMFAVMPLATSPARTSVCN